METRIPTYKMVRELPEGSRVVKVVNVFGYVILHLSNKTI